MKALILSGGRGTRLRPITYTSAKQLVPIANKPILFYGLEAIRDAGIRDVGIVVGETAEEVKRVVGDGTKFGLRIVYIPQESPDGLAHAVKISRDYLNDEPFVMYLGDNLLKDGIRSFVEEFGKGGADAQILLAQVDNPGDFGVAELDGGRVVALEEKPKRPKSNYALVGVYLFNHHVFEAVDNIKPSQRNELEITDAIQYLIDHKRVVKSHVVDGWWKDTGKLDDILEANHMFLQDIEPSRESEPDNVSKIRGRVQIGKNVTIEDSELRGPCVIGEGARIIGAYVGPFTSIGPRTEISHSEIENSIVLEDCVIKDVGSRIGNSLIGRNVTVSKNKKPPQTYQLVVGDNSQIVIL